MPTVITMPRLTQTMDSGRLLRWLRREGQSVAEGEPLFEVETDKAAVEVESPASGVLGPTLVREGEEVQVGSPIAHILAPGEAPPHGGSAPGELASTGEPRRAFRASPLAKKLAAQLGIDLAGVKGSGPDGRIDKDDVLAAAAAAAGDATTRGAKDVPNPSAVEPSTAETREPTPIRRATAERMAASARETARVTLFTEVDATELIRTRKMIAEEFEKLSGTKLSLTHLVVKACAMGLREHPHMLEQWADGRLRATREVNIGVAVATDQGLLVPVLRNADRLNIKEIAQRTADMLERARKGSLSQAESSGGTFTITNLGMYEVDGFTPIINPPETAILGVGRFAEKPAMHDGRVEARWLGVLSLSFDHRVVDGAPAGAFLQRLRRLLEMPQVLFL